MRFKFILISTLKAVLGLDIGIFPEFELIR